MSDTDNPRWQAVTARDARLDGQFWYGVITTGVYCRPSCASRRPRRENVRFFDSPDAARRSGMRPCRRCRPDRPMPPASLEVLLELCRHIERHPQQRHSLSALSQRCGLSQFQVHRLFKSLLQLTPQRYIEAVRLKDLKRTLRASSSVTEAIYDSGFESSSAVYGRMDAHLGMTPKRYRAGGSGVSMSFAFGSTALGRVLIGATDRGICYVQFGDSERELLEQLAAEYPQACIEPSAAAASEPFALWMRELNQRIERARATQDLPLDVQGTAFQKRVWDFLQTIPTGEVRSYGEVAEAIGAPRAVRAVASACARNRLGVLIPCHRVIRGTGALGGYRWGLPRKRALLDGERRPAPARGRR